MAIFCVNYTYDPARADEMDEVRPRHREFLKDLYDRGTLRLVGSWKEPFLGALLILDVADASSALAILDDDPFLTEGFIRQRHAHPYTIVYGALAD